MKCECKRSDKNKIYSYWKAHVTEITLWNRCHWTEKFIQILIFLECTKTLGSVWRPLYFTSIQWNQILESACVTCFGCLELRAETALHGLVPSPGIFVWNSKFRVNFEPLPDFWKGRLLLDVIQWSKGHMNVIWLFKQKSNIIHKNRCSSYARFIPQISCLRNPGSVLTLNCVSVWQLVWMPLHMLSLKIIIIITFILEKSLLTRITVFVFLFILFFDRF